MDLEVKKEESYTIRMSPADISDILIAKAKEKAGFTTERLFDSTKVTVEVELPKKGRKAPKTSLLSLPYVEIVLSNPTEEVSKLE